jgi:predicted PurR-regulated permease PerM
MIIQSAAAVNSQNERVFISDGCPGANPAVARLAANEIAAQLLIGYADLEMPRVQPRRHRDPTAMTDGDAEVERRPSRPVGRFAGATTLTSVGVAVVTVALLQYGQDFLIPFALAMLLSFVLAPLVNRLRAWHIPRVPAVLLTVAVAFVVISAFSIVVSRQVVSLANNIPTYQRNIEAKIHTLRGAVPGGGLVERAAQAVKDIQDDLSVAAQPEAAQRQSEARREPVPVRVEGSEPSPVEVVMGLLSPVLGPLATGGLVIVLAIFMLLGKEDLRDRLIRIIGTRDLHRTTEALNEAATRVSRYLLAQLVVNATYGLAIGAGLYVIGVPNPVLWGLLATVLRFIPYVGPILAATFPLALSVAVTPQWTLLIWTAALFVVVELISNNVVEPWLYGASTGVSTIAILFAAVFWTWVWGPVGLLLSTPLTVCLVVLGRYLPQMGLFNILFGSEPVLTAPERFYQRLLADDTEEALDIAEDYLADADRRRGVLEPARVRAMAAAVSHVVEVVAEPEGETARPTTVLCVAVRTELDGATAAMLAALLRQSGYAVDVLQPRQALAWSPRPDASLICACMLQATTRSQAERVWRRYARRLPQVPVVFALWDERPEDDAPASAAAPASFKKVLAEIDAASPPAAPEAVEK